MATCLKPTASCFLPKAGVFIVWFDIKEFFDISFVTVKILLKT